MSYRERKRDSDMMYYRRHQQELDARSKEWTELHPNYMKEYNDKRKEFNNRYCRIYAKTHRPEANRRNRNWRLRKKIFNTFKEIKQ